MIDCVLTFSPFLAPKRYKFPSGKVVPRGSKLWRSDQVLEGKRAVGYEFLAKEAEDTGPGLTVPGKKYLLYVLCASGAAAAVTSPAAAPSLQLAGGARGGAAGIGTGLGGFIPEFDPIGRIGPGQPPPIVLEGCLGLASPYIEPSTGEHKYRTQRPPLDCTSPFLLATVSCQSCAGVEQPCSGAGQVAPGCVAGILDLVNTSYILPHATQPCQWLYNECFGPGGICTGPGLECDDFPLIGSHTCPGGTFSTYLNQIIATTTIQQLVNSWRVVFHLVVYVLVCNPGISTNLSHSDLAHFEYTIPGAAPPADFSGNVTGYSWSPVGGGFPMPWGCIDLVPYPNYGPITFGGSITAL